MAVAPSHCVLNLHSVLRHHTTTSFLTRACIKSASFFYWPRAARLVSIRCVRLDQDDAASEVGSKATSSSSSSAAYAIDFLTLCNSLKTTKRKGWINHGIKGPESIADHMTLMSLFVGDMPGINLERFVKFHVVGARFEGLVLQNSLPKSDCSVKWHLVLKITAQII